MAPYEHVEQVLLFPAVQEALHAVDAGLRPSVVQALTIAIREARHDERRICAKIAVDAGQAAVARGDRAWQDAAEAIATAIVVRDVVEEPAAT